VPSSSWSPKESEEGSPTTQSECVSLKPLAKERKKGNKLNKKFKKRSNNTGKQMTTTTTTTG
jgi:hypothetical protein